MVEASLRGRFLVVALVLLVAAAGLLSFPTLPSGLLPRLDVPTVSVFVENPALGAEEMEALVLRPLEGRLRGLPGVQTVFSSAQQGLAQVSVRFDWSTALQEALQRVTAAVGQAQPGFPAGTLPPTIGNPSSSINQVLQYYLEPAPGSDVDARELRTAADVTVAPALQAIPGVLRVMNVGGEVRTFEVAADVRRLAAYDLALEDVAGALRDATASFVGNVVPEGAREILVRPSGRVRTLDDLRGLVVGEREGRAVLLTQVADVREGSLVRRTVARVEGRPVVGGTLVTQFGADTGPIVERAKEVLREIGPALPPGVRVRVYFDESELVAAAVKGLRDALLAGAVAVVVIIFLLLWDATTTLIIAAVLPVVVCVTFLAMRAFDVGVNVMSMGGIAVALGIMVDSAIVDAENIFRRLQEEPDDPFEATVQATLEVRRPITYATLIIVATFVPVFFLPGLAGRIFEPFGFTVIAAMLIGYAVSLTFTPALCFSLLPGRVRGRRESPVLRPVRRVFEPALRRAVRHPFPALAAGLALAAGTVLIVPVLGTEFLPAWDEGLLLVKAQTPPGTGVDETTRLAGRVADVVHGAPDVARVFFWAGRPEGSEEPEGANNSEITVTLAPFTERTHGLDEIRAWLREHLGAAPGARVLLTSPMTERMEESLSGGGAAGGGPLVAQIYGDDLDVLADRLGRLAALVRSLPGVADVLEEQTVGLPQLEVRTDPVAAARVGLTRADVSRAVELALGGQAVTSVFEGARQEIPVVMRADEGLRHDPERLGDLLLATPAGGAVPLRSVAALERTRGPHRIARENGQRRVQLAATLEDRDLGSVAEDLQRLAPALALPHGYRMELGGSYRSQREVQTTMLLAFVLSLLFVYLVLHLAFDSAGQAALVLFSIPLSLLGGFAALWVTGGTLNVSSLIGLLAHLGLSVQKAVILIEYANDRVTEGMDPREAAFEAGRVRMRPVLMTALAASLAVAPLTLGFGAGAELQRPLAIVLVGGLITSTPLVLFLLPALYPWAVAPWRKAGERPRPGAAAA